MMVINRAAAAALAVALLAGCGGSAEQTAQNVATQAPAIVKDALIVATVKTKITAADIDSTATVRVASHAGTVTLKGRVRTAAAKSKVVAAAKSVDGVAAVDDELTVDPSAPNLERSADDAGLVAKVEANLAGQTGLNAFHVRVTASAGTVTLAGTVGSAAIKSTMLAAARNVSGVRHVVDAVDVRN